MGAVKQVCRRRRPAKRGISATTIQVCPKVHGALTHPTTSYARFWHITLPRIRQVLGHKGQQLQVCPAGMRGAGRKRRMLVLLSNGGSTMPDPVDVTQQSSCVP
jgi:hypothetical protein